MTKNLFLLFWFPYLDEIAFLHKRYLAMFKRPQSVESCLESSSCLFGLVKRVNLLNQYFQSGRFWSLFGVSQTAKDEMVEMTSKTGKDIDILQ